MDRCEEEQNVWPTPPPRLHGMTTWEQSKAGLVFEGLQSY